MPVASFSTRPKVLGLLALILLAIVNLVQRGRVR